MITREVAAALDRTNTSDRKAAQIFSAMASLGQLKHDPEDVVISSASLGQLKHDSEDVVISSSAKTRARI